LLFRIGFLRFYGIVVRLEKRRHYTRHVNRHGYRISALVKLTLAAVAATQATLADMVPACVFRAVDAYLG
jgi:hypothetical protein